jgi:hypothetical protein
MKNVFNESKCSELSLKDDIQLLFAKQSDRGMSIDEGPEYEGEKPKSQVGKDEVELLR